MSSHLHTMLSVKLSLTMNWENSKDLILLNSTSFFKNLTCFNVFIMLCKAELTCWHHTAIHALLSVKQSWLADIILLFMLCKAELCWHHTVISRPAPLAGTILLSRALLSVKQSWLADIILLLLVLCSVCWHHTVKYLCFTAELVMKKYRKISFTDQMLRSTEIKWARKREDTDSA